MNEQESLCSHSILALNQEAIFCHMQHITNLILNSRPQTSLKFNGKDLGSNSEKSTNLSVNGSFS